uniref:histidine kinase n=1 Tax=Desulfobacca acetoxidans TaxID=60893 RepID=A0A7C5ENC8_9BACT
MSRSSNPPSPKNKERKPALVSRGEMSAAAPEVLKRAAWCRPGPAKEMELRKTKAYLEKVLEESADAISIVNRQGYFIRWNKKAEELMGYSFEEIRHLHFSQLYAYPEEMEEMLQKLRRDGFVRQYGIHLRKKDGTVAPFELSISLLRNDNQEVEGSICISRDLSDLKKALVAVEEANRHLKEEIAERRRVEAELLRAKEEWELTFDAVPDLISILDQNQNILNLNRAMAERLGLAKDKAQGCKCYEVVHGTTAPPPFCPFAQMAADRRPRSLEVFEVKWGAHFQIYLSPLRSDDGKFLGGVHVIRDITPKKQAEAAKKEQFLFLETLLDTIPSPIFYKDAAGRYLGCNRAFEKFLGRSREELLGKTVYEVAPPELAKQYAEMDRELLSRLGEQVYESRVRSADGTVHEVIFYKASFPKADGRVGGLVGVILDITQRKETEEELRRANQEIEQLFASIPFMMLGLTTEGRIWHWNPEAERLLWPNKPPTPGKPLKDCALTWEWDKVQAGLEKCCQTKQPVRVEDLRYQRGDGREGFLGLTFSPIRGDDGRLLGIILLGRDITDRRLLEAQLAQAQKLEAIGQLAAGIAHEINTPIQFVGDNTRFLKEAFEDLGRLLQEYDRLRQAVEQGEEAVEPAARVARLIREVDLDYLSTEIPQAIAQTLEGVERVATIVRAMKDFSHPGPKEKRPVNLNKAIVNTITVARNEWKYVAEMVTRLDPDLPLVTCLPDEINQVLLNLIINAAQAIGEVVDRGKGEKGRITVTSQSDGDWVEIRIADTGPGIPENIRSRIFDPFFTTKEVGKGTGQGLSLAHAVIVERHKGNLFFETEVGKGTTFIIRLPRGKPAS